MKLNVNCKVKIKLTDAGKKFLKQRHDYLSNKYDKNLLSKFELPATDKKGYSEWQLWDLFGVFGACMQVPTMSPPFEPVILIDED